MRHLTITTIGGMKPLVSAAILLWIAVLAPAAEVLPLPEVYVCPEILEVDGELLVHNYSFSFYVYGLKPFRLKAKFGGEGEGPGEFKNLIHLSVRPPEFVIYTVGKLATFSLDGKLLKEVKVPRGRHLVPAGENYVGYSMGNRDRFITVDVNLYRADAGQATSLVRNRHYFQINRPLDLVRFALGRVQRAHYRVTRDRIFVQGDDDTIHVFDLSGRKRYDISLNYDKRKVEDADKAEIHDMLNLRFKSDRMRQLIRENGFFPDRFPAGRFLIDGERIYVPTFQRQGNETRFVVLDLQGTILKSIHLPLSYLSAYIPFTFTIHGHRLYRFVENEDEEHLEIHVHDIPD